MSEAILVSDMILEIRDRTDQVDSQFVTDAELVRYINSSWKQLYNKIVDINPSYYLSTYSVPTVAGTDTYALPADFFKVMGIDINLGANRAYTATPFNFNERNRRNYVGNITFDWRYNIQGNNVKFIPEVSSQANITMWYIPRPNNVTATTDTIDSIQGFYEWIIVDVSIKVLKKEESDVQEFVVEKRELENQMVDTLAVRDEGFPGRITDVDNIQDIYYSDTWGR